MLRLVPVALIAMTTLAVANGRPPATSSINFRHGHEQDIAVGITFGLLLSHDGGQSWQWVCEDAVHYAGVYDPAFAYTQSGALFATTLTGLEVERDGCNFDPTPLATVDISASALAANGDLFVAASMSTDPKLYKSTDDGKTFPITAMPAPAGVWWDTIAAAPSDPMRVYATGYHFTTTRMFDVFRSIDGGVSYTPMQLTGVTTTANSEIFIVGVSPQNPDELYIRVTFQTINAISEAVYVSTNAGDSWTKIRDETATLSFLLRANGDLVIATKTAAVVSRAPSGGATWEALPSPPHINCLVENAAGEVWACTDNYGTEAAGAMKTTDLVTWTPVLRYQDIQGPLDCPAGTLQHDQCVYTDPPPRAWCLIRDQLGIASDPTDPACPSADGPIKKPGGCCNAGADLGGQLALIGVTAVVLGRSRRRRRR